MVKILNTSYESEIHKVDSPSNEDSKNIIFFCQGALFSGEGRQENLVKWRKSGKSILMQIREWSILIWNTRTYSLVSKSLHRFGFPTY